MGGSTIRMVLVAFNLFCFVWGTALTITGLVLRNAISDTIYLNDKVVLHVTTIDVALGVFIVLVSLLGLCGILQSSYCLLCTYALLLVALIITQIVLAIMLNMSQTHQDDIRKWFEAFFAKNMYLREPSMEFVINWVQRKYQCCGLHSSADWGAIVPRSCCKPGTARISCVPYSSGCEPMMEQAASGVGVMVGWVLLGITVAEFVALVLACIVINEFY
ncbi:tetraspanin-3-like [Uranotaenia lowii]|uniref:tetraspanin-3-like n=1 Tax=Uranotaenia lowii TaxID=190385 RepID=UPI002478F359|nr:tetraspanin-3-like [Uranotaenia lowii]